MSALRTIPLLLTLAIGSQVAAQSFDHARRPGVPCASCHRTPRHTDFGACDSCHVTRDWFETRFSHDKTAFPLDGKHRDNINATCEACHAPMKRGAFTRSGRACTICHADPHTETKQQSATLTGCAACHDTDSWRRAPFDEMRHRQRTDCASCHRAKHGLTYSGACASCHEVKSWLATSKFNHQATAFPLDRRHRGVACASCHDPKKSERTSPQCGSCHEDPHRGRAQRECDDCHRADRWTLIRFDHDRSLFPLRGRHFSTPCRDCHSNDELTGVSLDCIACHRGDWARANSQNKDHRIYSLDCKDCHNAFRW